MTVKPMPRRTFLRWGARLAGLGALALLCGKAARNGFQRPGDCAYLRDVWRCGGCPVLARCPDALQPSGGTGRSI